MIADESRADGTERGEPLVPSAAGPTLPGALDPVVTVAAIQRYLQAERDRSRRTVLWVSAVFILALMVILMVTVLIGTVVLRNASRAVDIADRVEGYVAAQFAGLVGVSNRIVNLETAHLQVRDEIRTWEDLRAEEAEAWKADLESLARGLQSGQAAASQTVAVLEGRLADMEQAAAAGRREAEAARQQYEALLAAVSLPQVPADAPMAADEEGLGPADLYADAEPTRPERPPDRGEWDAVVPTNEAVFAVEEILPVQPPQEPMEIQVVTLPNGDRYEGQFKEGLFHGWGVYHFQNGDRYEGEFQEDMKNGRGMLIYRNGDRYVGDFTNDMKGGRGSLLFHGNDKYVGEFANDMMHGKGTMLYANGNRYAGEFRNGLKHGSGVFRFFNGDLYSGEFAGDLRNGRGVYVSHSGAKYIGEFQDGRRHGKGRYLYPSGEEYSGEFKDGKKEGFGICTYPNGRQLRGVWRDDRFVRLGEG